MKLKFLIFTLLSLFSLTKVEAQRILGDLETNADPSMMTRGDTASNKSDKIIIPTEVHAWVVDGIFGNMKPIHVDTLTHAYQNNSLSEGMRGEYQTLGNLASPRINRIFMEREESNDFIFLNPFNQFYVNTGNFRHYNTKSPYMNISYNSCGSKTTGYDNLDIIYTQNIGKRANFGARYKYMYGQGYYNSQNTGFMNTSAWTSYKGERYGLHFYYQYNYMKMAENGGITDESYITHPESQSIKYGTADIPTFLHDTWTRQQQHIVFLNHHYDMGFERAEGDSTNRVITFVPVMKIFHTLKIDDNWRNHKAYYHPTNYHSYTFMRNDSIDDRTSNFTIRNNVGISFCEGFQKWAVFGLNAYAGFEHRTYALPDTIAGGGFDSNVGRLERKKYNEYDFVVGGQMIRTMGKLIHYNVDAEFVLIGSTEGKLTNSGQFTVSGHGELNIPFWKDTLQVAVNGYVKNVSPSFYYRHFHATHAWWDQETSKEFKQRIQAVLTFPKTFTTLTVGFESINNFTYFANEGITTADGTITNNAVAKQYGGNIRVFSATLDQNFALGPLHLDNNVTYQNSSNPTVLPLPAITTYNNLYVKFKIAKVLKVELGADMKYFTNYNAPDYSPVIGMFMTQHKDKPVKIGNYPLISAYANCELKRLRFYVQYYHANEGSGRSFWGPGYPMNPAGLHLGLSWNFYD